MLSILYREAMTPPSLAGSAEEDVCVSLCGSVAILSFSLFTVHCSLFAIHRSPFTMLTSTQTTVFHNSTAHKRCFFLLRCR